MGRYVFDNAAKEETAARFAALQGIFDPVTHRIVDAMGAGSKGSHCLEVGGGGGSIVEWLSRRVGPQGRVHVTDIDPGFLSTALAELPNVEVVREDIAKDDLQPEAYDFVHTRLVLQHVPEYEKGVDNMVRSLKSHGHILLEDFDNASLSWTESVGPPSDVALYRRLAIERMRIFRAHGVHPEMGRRLPSLLQERGIVGIGFEPTLTVWRGGTAGGALDKANYRQLRAEVLEGGLFSETEFDEALKVFDHPSWSRISPLMVSAWGHRP